MEDTLVCGWDEFESHAADTIKQLWDDNESTDVTLATMDEQQINVHRIVLSSSSSFFKLILSKNPQKNLVIYLKDIGYKELKLVLEFMYFGESKVRHADLGTFIATGNTLKVRGLIDSEVERSRTDVKSGVLDEELIKDDQMLQRFDKKREIISNSAIFLESQKEKENDTLKSQQPDIENSDEKSSEQTFEKISPTPQNKRDRLYKQNINKSNHISAQFFQEGFFRCDECPVLYDDIEDFKKHKRICHGGIMYSCNQCQNKSKHFQEGLMSHMFKHGGGAWYYCDQCEFRAAKSERIKTHRMTMHGNANYACDQCDYRSTRQFNLKHHMKAQHEGVRYECDQCDHKATLPNNLMKHKLRYHREKSVTVNQASK